MIPVERGLAYAASSVFLTLPRRVAKSRNRSGANSLTAISAATFSSWVTGSRLTIALLARRARLRHLVDLQRVHLADRGEVRRKSCVEARTGARPGPRRARRLRAGRGRPASGRGRSRPRPLDVAGAGDRHHHVLLGDQVLDRELGFLGRISVRRGLAKRRLVSSSSPMMMSSTSFSEARIAFNRAIRASTSLCSLMISRARGGQALQPHVEDRLRLHLRETELLHQGRLRRRRVRRRPDRLDHLVEVVERDHQPFQDVARSSARARS